jgi:ferredoxin
VSAGRCIASLTPLLPNSTPPPDAVLFESRGAVLILGDDAAIADVVDAVAQHHRAAVFAPGIDALRFGPRVTVVGTRVSALHGRFGAFRGDVRGPQGMKDIGAASPNRDGLFDLVLDLGRQPLIAAAVAPLGYFAPGADATARGAVVDAMRLLVGSFIKPRYFQYRAEWCAHGASGVKGCTRCLEVCSTSAITSAGEQIRVDPYLCQGCATCTLACPTGALSFRQPSSEQLRQQLAEALSRAVTSTPALLVVHGASQAEAVQQAVGERPVLTLAADPLPAFGEELWLEAFALGAQGVVLLDGEHMAPASRELIAARVATAGLQLQALGVPAHRLRFMPVDGLADWLDAQTRSPGAAARAPARAAPAAGPPARPAAKRLAQLASLAQLAQGAAAVTMTELPADACFGEVRVDPVLCLHQSVPYRGAVIGRGRHAPAALCRGRLRAMRPVRQGMPREGDLAAPPVQAACQPARRHTGAARRRTDALHQLRHAVYQSQAAGQQLPAHPGPPGAGAGGARAPDDLPGLPAARAAADLRARPRPSAAGAAAHAGVRSRCQKHRRTDNASRRATALSPNSLRILPWASINGWNVASSVQASSAARATGRSPHRAPPPIMAGCYLK